VALLKEDSVEDTLRDGGGYERPVEEEDDSVGLGKDKGNGGDEGCFPASIFGG
jgi:hypothetical protein